MNSRTRHEGTEARPPNPLPRVSPPLFVFMLLCKPILEAVQLLQRHDPSMGKGPRDAAVAALCGLSPFLSFPLPSPPLPFCNFPPLSTSGCSTCSSVRPCQDEVRLTRRQRLQNALAVAIQGQCMAAHPVLRRQKAAARSPAPGSVLSVVHRSTQTSCIRSLQYGRPLHTVPSFPASCCPCIDPNGCRSQPTA